VPGRNIDFSRKPEIDKNPKRGIPFSSSKALKRSLVSQHTGEKSIAHPQSNDYLSEPEFISLAAQILAREFDADELVFLARFFYEAAPLRRIPVEDLLTQAASAKGTKLHLRFYCHHIRVAMFKQRR
jgi:hypothetical protein